MFGRKTGGLLLAGAAAYAYYKYNKMTPEERRQVVAGVKEKGQRIYDKYVPGEVKNLFDKKGQSSPGGETTNAGNEYAV